VYVQVVRSLEGWFSPIKIPDLSYWPRKYW